MTYCLFCNSELVKQYGESAARKAKRRYCNRSCRDAAKETGNGLLTDERMPWPLDYGRVEFHLRSSLAGLAGEE